MTGESQGPPSEQLYVLTCLDCAFEETVEGTIDDVLDAIGAHQAASGDTLEHFVEFEILEE